MMKDVLAWTSSYLDALLPKLPNAGCCCSADPRDHPLEKRDVVVPNEWDAFDSHSEQLGEFSEPAAVRKLAEGGQPAQAESSDDAGAQEALQLRELMKSFVQGMIRGRAFRVVVEEGQTDPCKLSLARNLMHLSLEIDGSTHDIPLGNVKDVCLGNKLSNRFAPVNLDELCSTLVLRNNECVSFRLSSIKERDDFTKCVKVLALALDR
mmetsp:Transcript_32108/g.92276  ORF Transcript_32108/g.92276 Transcript_32108/m.92276 type:complete len:208 (+) Transcript_32108:63-686(+)